MNTRIGLNIYLELVRSPLLTFAHDRQVAGLRKLFAHGLRFR